MTIYEITSDRIQKIEETSFSDVRVRERQDLQRLLRSQIDIIAPDILVISEEFSQWEDSRRRIDLLGIDKNANLVVIELKRSDDGGHMELQAIRYAAMISAMTFERAVEVYSLYLENFESSSDARSSLLKFLDWDEPDEDQFAQDVRIVLVSAEFSKELTTAVLWLNGRGLDIQCIRMKPYNDNGRILVDIQQIIPLPDAEDYQVRLKEKQQKERASRLFNGDFTKYDVAIGDEEAERLPKKRLAYEVIRYLCQLGYSPEHIAASVPWRESNMFRMVEGNVESAEFIAMASNQGRFSPGQYYCGEEELIRLNGNTYAVSSHWGRDTIKAIDNMKQACPDAKIEYSPSPR